jgi:hypothetical protein
MNRKPDQILTLTETELIQNSVLAGLNEAERSKVLRVGKLLHVETPRQIYDAGCPIEEVYFPIDAVLSVVAHMRNGGSIEVGTVGREGFSAIRCCSGLPLRQIKAIAKLPGVSS